MVQIGLLKFTFNAESHSRTQTGAHFITSRQYNSPALVPDMHTGADQQDSLRYNKTDNKIHSAATHNPANVGPN